MLGLFFGGKISTNVSGKWGGQVGKRKGKNPTGWGGGSQGSGLRLPVRAAFPLYPSQVSGNQAKFLGPVGGAWAQWNTPQVGRYPVIRDTHVVKVGAVSTPKVCVIIHWHPLPSHLTGGIQIQRGEPRITVATQQLVHYLTVAGELDQQQGASSAQRGAGAWGEEQAGTLVARAPSGEGEALLPGE